LVPLIPHPVVVAEAFARVPAKPGIEHRVWVMATENKDAGLFDNQIRRARAISLPRWCQWARLPAQA
jgi:hypothetical protein